MADRKLIKAYPHTHARVARLAGWLKMDIMDAVDEAMTKWADEVEQKAPPEIVAALETIGRFTAARESHPITQKESVGT